MEKEINVTTDEVMEDVCESPKKGNRKKAFLAGGITAIGLGLVYAVCNRRKKVYYDGDDSDNEYDDSELDELVTDSEIDVEDNEE